MSRDNSKIENFIRTKYDTKRWVMDGGMPDPSTLGDGDDDVVSPTDCDAQRCRIAITDLPASCGCTGEGKDRTFLFATNGTPSPTRTPTTVRFVR